jgi:hypothetical protein
MITLRGFHLWYKCNIMVQKPRRSSLVEQKTPVSSKLVQSGLVIT